MYSAQREQFLSTLASMVDELERRSIDYRAIGSVAAEASGIFEIDFAPRNAVDQIDKGPDFDVIVPRSDLLGAREVRALFQKHEAYPLKLGLAIPSMQVDLRPGERMSRLTLGRHAMPVESRVFDAQEGAIAEVSLRTVPAETLRHFYSCMSPADGRGDRTQTRLAIFDDAIGEDASHDIDDPYASFHAYAELAHRHTPLSRRTMGLFHRATAHMTPEQRNHFRHIAFKIAGLAGWR